MNELVHERTRPWTNIRPRLFAEIRRISRGKNRGKIAEIRVGKIAENSPKLVRGVFHKNGGARAPPFFVVGERLTVCGVLATRERAGETRSRAIGGREVRCWSAELLGGTSDPYRI